MRVVSLVPSATEILCAIGGAELLVGRSHECDYPGAIADRPVLTRPRTASGPSRIIDEQVRAANGQRESLYEVDTNASLRTCHLYLILVVSSVKCL